MQTIAGRRGLLGLGLAGSLAAAVPAVARETVKPGAETFVSPPERLMRGHAVLARVLLIYEAGLRRIGQGEDIDPLVLSRAAEICRRFVHQHLEKMEEELVFTRFREGGRMVELVGTLAQQHAAGARLTDDILAKAPQVRSREPRQALEGYVQALVAMYRPHVAREATDIFPTLRHLVTAEQYAEIADEMERRERQAVGAEGLTTIAKQVADVEGVIGLRNIDVFTPKD
jgi:hemerythrin-like domain-containing protein